MSKENRMSDNIKLALFVAIIILLSVTPLGYISLGVIYATTIQIPVILGGILFGWKKGAFLGFVFGITSLIKNTIQPGITSFVFSPFIPVFGEEKGSFLALIVCLIPRIMIGMVSAFLYNVLSKTKIQKPVSCAICGFFGSLTNTIFVMGGIYFFFGHSYSAARSEAYETLIGTVMATITGIGVTEAAVSAVLAMAVCVPLLKYLNSAK